MCLLVFKWIPTTKVSYVDDILGGIKKYASILTPAPTTSYIWSVLLELKKDTPICSHISGKQFK